MSRCKTFTETADIFSPTRHIGTLDINYCDFEWSVDAFATELSGGKPMEIVGGKMHGGSPRTTESTVIGRARLCSHVSTNIRDCDIRVGHYELDGRSSQGISAGGQLVEGSKSITVNIKNCEVAIEGSGEVSSRDCFVYAALSTAAEAVCELIDCRFKWSKHASFAGREIIQIKTWVMGAGSLDIYFTDLDGGVKTPASFTTYTASNNVA